LSFQRTMQSVRHRGGNGAPRNPGLLPGTYGSRQRAHKMSGSVKSTGLSTPWCSVRCTAFSSRK